MEIQKSSDDHLEKIDSDEALLKRVTEKLLRFALKKYANFKNPLAFFKLSDKQSGPALK
jgi:hypothetical protein